MMTFRSAYIRLTLFYVLIVMVISFSFSAVLYGVSYQELGRGLNRQAKTICDADPGGPFRCSPLVELEKIRHAQLDESRVHLIFVLLYFNILILLASAILSYISAKHTLRPIEEMMEAQQRFTADASHELKTPLTAMRTEIEVALRDKGMTLADSRKLFSSNLEEINKLESLSSALLRLSKYKEEVRLEFAELELTDLIIEAYEKVESLAKEKDIKFKNKFEAAKVKGDRASLVELFVILLDNAIKYSPKNSAISISVHKEDKHAVVEIADQGVGIDESDLPHIFDRFYRADASRTKGDKHGYGLGLAIAKSIIDLHDGKIRVSNTSKQGTTFELKFDN
jgi:two-component system sensor histidine kinase CiaH